MNIGFKILENTALPKLESFPGEVQREIKAAFGEIGAHVAGGARQIVPVRTGRLRASIDFKPGESTVQVYADTPYARYVEFGTSKWAGKAFLRPALAQSQGFIEGRVRSAVMRALVR